MPLRTEQIQIKRTETLSRYSHISKNLWNEANYAIRQKFFLKKGIIRYNQLNQLFKTSENYKELSAQSAQHILKTLDKSWKSYFRVTKQYEKSPYLFLGKPRIPHYKAKNGEFMLIFTNQQCEIKENFLIFPKKFDMKFKTRLEENTDLREVRIIPKGTGYILEIVYIKKEAKEHNLDRNNFIGLDYGLINIVTIANNIGLKPIVVKGGAVKSMNQFYNKRKAKLQSIYDKQEIKYGKKMSQLNMKRNNKMKDAMHKISRFIVDYCMKHNIGTIVIGHNEYWKQNINLGRKTNQNFVSIPYYILARSISYKAEEIGIEIKLQNESHTSKCSFLDNEPIEHRKEYVGKRTKRGIFRTKNNYTINADVNASLNIIRKSNPEAFNHLTHITGRDRGTGLVPCKWFLPFAKAVC